MPRLTLRTLLAYIDDTLGPAETRALGKKVAESDEAKTLVERIKRVTRRRGLATPVSTDPDDETADPNTVAEYLDNALDSATVKHVEETCLESDVHLAEVAACHQILTLVLTKPVRVPPHAHRRMYQLVPPPASVPDRKPSKTLPVGGGAPPSPEGDEADDADAALLLGLGRYSAATTWVARFALLGAALVLLVLVAGAALLSLQQTPQKAPETAGAHSSSSYSPPAAVGTPVEPKPKDKEPAPPSKPKEKEPVEAVAPMPTPVRPEGLGAAGADPGPGLGDPIPPPNNDRPREIGQVRTNRVLVVTQPPGAGAQWVRLRLKADDDEAVMSNWALMALPGYKADVSIEKKVLVRLWGNVPEQLPYRVLESRVKFHSPPAGYDADITLLGGRIYLKSERREGAKVRLRLGPEVWDVTIPDQDTDVLAELISWFEPGTVYARTGGSKPKLEARVAVVFGTAAFSAPARYKKFDKLPRAHQVTWDSVTNNLSDPKLIEPEMREQLLFRDSSDLKGDLFKQVTRLLSAAADKVTTREGLQSVIKERVGPDLPDTPPADRDLVSRLAVYAQAALADCNADGAATLKALVDVLRSELPWLARQAVVTALVNWTARDVGNTVLLHSVLVEKGMSEKDADWLLTLLRGFISPLKPNPARLDELVEPVPPRERALLGDPEVALREAALWNLMVVKLESWVPLPLLVNVGAVGAKVDSGEYMRFLKDMKTEVENLKKRQLPPPPK
jgi:hypothetical protein